MAGDRYINPKWLIGKTIADVGLAYVKNSDLVGDKDYPHYIHGADSTNVLEWIQFSDGSRIRIRCEETEFEPLVSVSYYPKPKGGAS